MPMISLELTNTRVFSLASLEKSGVERFAVFQTKDPLENIHVRRLLTRQGGNYLMYCHFVVAGHEVIPVLF